MSILTANTTILEFLKTGGTLSFPNDSSLIGRPSDNYIDLRYGDAQSAGLRILNEEGLSLALSDEDIFPDTDELISDKLNPKSTLLDFMELGGDITFSNGSSLRSDTKTNYIDLISCFDGFAGVQVLNEEGLSAALKDKDLFPEEPEEVRMRN